MWRRTITGGWATRSAGGEILITRGRDDGNIMYQAILGSGDESDTFLKARRRVFGAT
jgi:hypothetical protein